MSTMWIRLELKGPGFIETTLYDKEGWRAIKLIKNEIEIAKILKAWEREYTRTISELFIDAYLEATPPTQRILEQWQISLFEKEDLKMHSLSLNEVRRMKKLRKSSYLPKPIVELKNKIAAEIRVAELRASANGGVIDLNHALAISGMKVSLDRLYTDWLKGKID